MSPLLQLPGPLAWQPRAQKTGDFRSPLTPNTRLDHFPRWITPLRIQGAAKHAALDLCRDRKAKRREVENMGGTRLTIDPDSPRGLPSGRVDHEALDATGVDDIARQARDDDAEAMRDMGRFARRVRRRLGLTQVEFARRICNWEQGKRGPTGAARALLRTLDKAPETALRVLG